MKMKIIVLYLFFLVFFFSCIKKYPTHQPFSEKVILNINRGILIIDSCQDKKVKRYLIVFNKLDENDKMASFSICNILPTYLEHDLINYSHYKKVNERLLFFRFQKDISINQDFISNLIFTDEEKKREIKQKFFFDADITGIHNTDYVLTKIENDLVDMKLFKEGSEVPKRLLKYDIFNLNYLEIIDEFDKERKKTNDLK